MGVLVIKHALGNLLWTSMVLGTGQTAVETLAWSGQGAFSKSYQCSGCADVCTKRALLPSRVQPHREQRGPDWELALAFSFY